MRSDGTTSFFVTDFFEVDSNVTRHIRDEIAKSDWDLSVLHYLGLDHIGHIHGPRAPQVPGKLEEMGEVIRLFREELVLKRERWRDGLPPLLIVLGDHGMADAGGHGGASMPEVMTPIVLVHPPMISRQRTRPVVIKQPDLVPTLSYLLGTPIPRNSLGVAIPNDLLVDDLTNVYAYNSIQLSQCAKKQSGYADDAYETLISSWRVGQAVDPADLEKSLAKMVFYLEDDLVDYYFPAIFGGIALVSLVRYFVLSEGKTRENIHVYFVADVGCICVAL